MFSKPERKSIRYKHWDYSSEGWYFVTMCTDDRQRYFGEIQNGFMCLSEIGAVTDDCWRQIPKHFLFVKMDDFVIMPDHFHGIINIDHSRGERRDKACLVPTDRRSMPNRWQNPGPDTLGTIIGGFKSAVTKQVRERGIPFAWQPRFYDRIIRNEAELNRLREYMRNNPWTWQREE